MPQCSRCQTPVFMTPDWTLWPWPDGEQLCSSCNDKRHEVDDWNEVEKRVSTNKGSDND